MPEEYVITKERAKAKMDNNYSVREAVTGILLVDHGKPTKYYKDNYINKNKNVKPVIRSKIDILWGMLTKRFKR